MVETVGESVPRTRNHGLDLLAGISAPMIQNNGKKIPIRNMTQWPFLIAMMPSVTSSTT